ncbi:MAG: COR domain-containing protein, partial [Dehalococcoidia bacterium]
VPEAISRLANLTSLNLGGNQLGEVPEEITRLTSLTELYLWGNGLREIPEDITRLTNLTMLNLNRLGLSAVPEVITRLTNLTSLHLYDNQLSEIPEEITRLTNLTSLDLTDNQLIRFPGVLCRLPSLRHLSLRNSDPSQHKNQIKEIPPEVLQLTNLETLDLSGLLLETPPPEVVARGLEAIRDYFRQLEAAGDDYLYEAKLLVVGEPGAGKSSLANKIIDPDYELQPEIESESTRGIDILTWEFDLLPQVPGYDRVQNQDKKFRVNIWDFAGQEIYHATHQFFLTRRSMYALVADMRQDNTDFYYWLDAVEMFSDNSPLVIVKNEKQNRQREIGEPQLRGRFANLKEVRATNLQDNRGLEAIVNDLENYLRQLPHIGTPLPKNWVNVREKLEQDQRDYISREEYLQICRDNGFDEDAPSLRLSGFLHDLGVILHFQEDPVLNHTVILNPRWGTDAAFNVLDDEGVQNNQGQFSRHDLESIWADPQYVGKHHELLQLLINFNLCYEIPNSNGAYIAPQLLSPDQPDYSWEEDNNLILRYTSSGFVPKGIITRFIVAMHHDIEDNALVWRSGVVLQRDGTRAEVIEEYEKREIQVRVTGRDKRDLMTIVTYELDKIFQSYHRIQYNKLIPCNCSQCKGTQNPHFYSFATLLRFRADGQRQIQCQISYEMVDVLSLLEDVFVPRQRRPGEDFDDGWRTEDPSDFDYRRHVRPSPPPPTPAPTQPSGHQARNPWVSGSFYLFAVVILTGLVVGVSLLFSPYFLAAIIVPVVLLLMIVGAFQLRQDERLSDQSFLKLMGMSLEKLPLIGKLFRGSSDS